MIINKHFCTSFHVLYQCGNSAAKPSLIFHFPAQHADRRLEALSRRQQSQAGQCELVMVQLLMQLYSSTSSQILYYALMVTQPCINEFHHITVELSNNTKLRKITHYKQKQKNKVKHRFKSKWYNIFTALKSSWYLDKNIQTYYGENIVTNTVKWLGLHSVPAQYYRKNMHTAKIML